MMPLTTLINTEEKIYNTRFIVEEKLVDSMGHMFEFNIPFRSSAHADPKIIYHTIAVSIIRNSDYELVELRKYRVKLHQNK